MKTNKWMAAMMLCTGFSLNACTSDDGLNAPAECQQGQLMLKLSSGTNFSEETRAVNEDSYKNTSNYTVKVFDKDGVERLSCKGSEINTNLPIKLNIGSYAVKAFYGTEHDASRDAFYVEGSASGTIKADEQETVSLVCSPTCGRIRVNFDSNMSTYCSDYKVEFKGTNALGAKSILWQKNDTDPWYVKLKEEGEYIEFTITATPKDEFTCEDPKTGRFKLDRNKSYKMNVKPGYVAPGSGEINFDITIDETTIDNKVDIVVPVTWI